VPPCFIYLVKQSIARKKSETANKKHKTQQSGYLLNGKTTTPEIEIAVNITKATANPKSE
jgi:hypothetical protein